MSMSPNMILDHPRGLVALLWASVGILLLGLSFIGFIPMQYVAVLFSEDGVLTESFIRLMEQTQVKLGYALLAAALLFSWVRADTVKRLLMALPPSGFYLLPGALALFLGLAVQERIFDGIPHMTDAISHLFQAQIFALGRFHVPAPPCPDAFYQFHILMTHSGEWFTKYTPGHALLLAAGIVTGGLKWVLPLSAAFTTVLLGRLVARYEGELGGRIFSLLWALSPLSILLSASYMSHYTALLFIVAGVGCYVCARDAVNPRRRNVFLVACGLSLAASLLVRPHEMVMIVIIGGLFFLSLKREEWIHLGKSLPSIILGTLPLLIFWGIWNARIYGTPFAIGYGFDVDDVIHPPFQGRFGLSETYTLRDAIAVLAWNLDRVNRSFLGWPSSLIFVPFAFILRGGRLVYLSCIGILVVMGIYFFYDYRSEYEARYYFLALPFFVYLTVRGMHNVVHYRPSPRWRAITAQGVFLLATAFYLHAGINYWNDYLVPRYSEAYEETSPAIEETVRRHGLSDALVLIQPVEGSRFTYSSGFIFNDPLLERDVIYARYREEELDCLRKGFPERRLFVYEGDADGVGLVYPLPDPS